MMKDSVAIVSGGLDSTTLMYDMFATDHNVVLALSFDYGQRHKKELQYAADNCARLGIEHKVVDLTAITPLLSGSALTDPNVSVPEGHYADETMKATVVPNRNMIMLSIATAAAVSRGAEAIGIGVHAGDHPIYPDCRPEFIFGYTLLAQKANDGFAHERLGVYAPFVHIGKHDIVTRGAELRVPFRDTWSCYQGGAVHCGKCGTCVERKEAFTMARVEDPTDYDDKTDVFVPTRPAPAGGRP